MNADPPTLRELQQALDVWPSDSRAAWELQSIIRRRSLLGARSAITDPKARPARH